MIPQSGRRRMPRRTTTSRPHNRYTASALLCAGDGGADRGTRAPMRGIGPQPGMQIMLNTMFRAVISTPKRSGVCASPAERSAPPTMKNINCRNWIRA